MLSLCIIQSLIFSNFQVNGQNATLPSPQQGQTASPSNESNIALTKTFDDSTHGIKIKYPSDWTFSKDNNNSDNENVVVASLSPISNGNVSLDVSIDNSVDTGTDLASLVADVSSSNSHDPSLASYKVIKSTPISESKINGLPTYELIYTYTDQKIPFQTIELGTIIGNKAYYVDYASPADTYSKYLPIAMDIVNLLNISSTK